MAGSYQSQRFSALNQITPENVKNLEQKWVLQDQVFGAWESKPAGRRRDHVRDRAAERRHRARRENGESVLALPLHAVADARVCCGANNRGVAMLGQTLYMGNARCASRRDRRAERAPFMERRGRRSEERLLASPLAPLRVKDKNHRRRGRREYGIRGFVAAYDAATGKEAWRFNTIPGPGEKGHETWSEEDWKTGGASAWVTGSYDPQLNLIYWGVGNPGPDWNPDQRHGEQSLFRFSRGAGCGHRSAEMAFPVHAERSLRL